MRRMHQCLQVFFSDQSAQHGSTSKFSSSGSNSRLSQTNPRSSLDATTQVVVAIDIGTVLVSTSVSARSRVSCCPRRKMARSSDTLSVSAHDLAMPQLWQSRAIRDPVVLMYQLPLDLDPQERHQRDTRESVCQHCGNSACSGPTSYHEAV
jgi:hypothetical protein